MTKNYTITERIKNYSMAHWTAKTEEDYNMKNIKDKIILVWWRQYFWELTQVETKEEE